MLEVVGHAVTEFVQFLQRTSPCPKRLVPIASRANKKIVYMPIMIN